MNDVWKNTGPGAAIARGPEDNLVGDPSDPVNKLQGMFIYDHLLR